MARRLASIVTISSCDPIPETDRLSVAQMEGKGWRVVTGRDEFRKGDLAVYFEIDSYLPPEDPRYAFLRERCLKKFMSKSGKLLREGLRIKTAKLRGVISQGLLMPLDAFPEITDNIVFNEEKGHDVWLGIKKPDMNGDLNWVSPPCDDIREAEISDVLGVAHYDEMVEIYTPRDNSANLGDTMGVFPSLIRKTDEERIQNLGFYFEEMKGRKFEVTEKNDGSSCTLFYSPSVDPEKPFGVCSRNRRIKSDEDSGKKSAFWEIVKKYGAQEKIEKFCRENGMELAFQGELVGPGVNGNRDLYSDYEWHVFKIWDIMKQDYLLPSIARWMCSNIGLGHVPVIEEEMDVFGKFSNVDELLAYAEGKTSRGNEREGLVFKSTSYPYVSFKAVSNRYLLKEK